MPEQLEVAPVGVSTDVYVQGLGLQTGFGMSHTVAVHVMVSQVCPASVCVQVDPLAIPPAAQLEVAPGGVIAKVKVQGSGLHTGVTEFHDPAVHVTVPHECPLLEWAQVSPLATLAPSPQLDVAPDGVIDDE